MKIKSLRNLHEIMRNSELEDDARWAALADFLLVLAFNTGADVDEENDDE